MKRLLNSKGFSAIEVTLVVIVMGLIGGTGYYVHNSQKETKKLLDSTNQTTPQKSSAQKNITTDPYADWETASFELIDASFKYPKTLKMAHDLKPNASSNTAFETFTLEASDRTTISLIAFHFLGGFTGDEPTYLIEDVVSGQGATGNREFSSIVYKNSNGEYDSAYVVDSTQTKYKVGEEKQIFLNAFSVKPKGVNTERSMLSITLAGQKYQTFKTLKDIKATGAYKDIELFIKALRAPSTE